MQSRAASQGPGPWDELTSGWNRHRQLGDVGMARLVIAARTTSIGRSMLGIARAEPVWVAAVGIGILAGAAVTLARPDAHRSALLIALAIGVTYVVCRGRADTRLMQILGVRPLAVRVGESLLWTLPVLGAATTVSWRAGLGALAAVVLAASIVRGQGGEAERRTVRWTFRYIPTILPEWVAGLRRAAVPLAGLAAAGFAGSASPGLVVAASAGITLLCCTFFWGPAEGWLLLYGSGYGAGQLLRRKILASAGLLCSMLGPILLLSTVRAPELVVLYGVVLAFCVHAHATAVALKYAGYVEGQPLHPAANLVWFVTTVALVVPPVAMLLMGSLFRRGVRRIESFCIVDRDER